MSHENFLHLPTGDQKEILEGAATRLGKQSLVLEKDVWVCWALQTLFSLDGQHPMAFKGGTSLSKVFGAINRFSEDIDVTLDYRSFGEDFDPFAPDTSRTAVKRYSAQLKDRVSSYARDVLVPHFGETLESQGLARTCHLDISEDGEKIRLHYPSAIEEGDEYLTPSVLIELGGRNVVDPNELREVAADLGALVSELDFPTAEVVVLSPERTFWEKATLMHVECRRGEIKASAHRLARHWYDLFMLNRHERGEAAKANRDLLEDVVAHKKVFFHHSFADYDACLDGGLLLVPAGEQLAALKKDYEQMLSSGMIYGDPPTFDEIIEGLRQLQDSINNN